METSTQPPSTPTNHPKPWLKWVLIIVAVALLSSGAMYFVLTQTQQPQPEQTIPARQVTQPTPTPLPAEVSTKEGDPTANWKTYTESLLQFQIKYPGNWEYAEERAGNPLHLLLYPKHTSNMSPRDPNDPLAPVELFVLNIGPQEELCKPEPPQGPCVDVKVDGVPAKRYQRNTYHDIVAFKKGSYLYELLSPKFDQAIFANGQYPRAYYAFYNLPANERKLLFSQILSTFRFTE